MGRKIRKVNRVLEGLLPFIGDRLRHEEPFQIPERAEDFERTAKKEAAFAMRRKAKLMQQERIENPYHGARRQAKGKILGAFADILEATIVDVPEYERQLEEDEEYYSDGYEDEYEDEEEYEDEDDYIDI